MTTEKTAPHRTRRRQRGSILILTLLAVGIIAGAYIYIGVIGSRSAEMTRARTAADATAMAAAIVKARTLNYEAYILLADTILLPLGQVTENITTAQPAGYVAALCPECCLAFCPLCAKCTEYLTVQIPKTASKQPRVNAKVTRWLDGLEMMAEALDNVGPFWAEEEAAKVGTTRPSYGGPDDHGVTYAASFPLPDRAKECGTLGIEMIDNMQPDRVEGRSACYDRKKLEFLYLTIPWDPIFTGWNILGEGVIGKLLTTGAACDKQNQVPQLGAKWEKFKYSRGMTLEKKPNDHWQLSYLETLRQTEPPKMLGTGWLLGTACAEHYAQDHPGKESLWHMDWRARLVPCEYDKAENFQQVVQCGGFSIAAPGATEITQQFLREYSLGIAKHWKW